MLQQSVRLSYSAHLSIIAAGYVLVRPNLTCRMQCCELIMNGLVFFVVKWSGDFVTLAGSGRVCE